VQEANGAAASSSVHARNVLVQAVQMNELPCHLIFFFGQTAQKMQETLENLSEGKNMKD